MKQRKKNIWGIRMDFYTQGAVFVLMIISITGIFSKLIANPRPYLIVHEGQIYFPVLSDKFERDRIKNGWDPVDWNRSRTNKILSAPIPYAPGQSDIANSNYRPPFAKPNPPNWMKNSEDPSHLHVKYHHWLGTNLKGEDVLSGLVHGTSVSLRIGFFSILLALIIGTVIGIASGYFQNDSLKIQIIPFVFILVGIIPSFYFSDLISFFVANGYGWEGTTLFIGSSLIYVLCFIFISTLAYLKGYILQKILRIRKKVFIPIDTFLSRMIEIFSAIPKLMLIVALAAILDRSITNVILIIGISTWSGIARLVRAETMKIRTLDYITSAKALGLSNLKIILRHIIPNISGPIIISFVFGLSTAILIESGLSFLNIGVPENVITWGQILADGKQNIRAWWLIVFPGLCIFITVLCLNILGEKFKLVLDPRNRSLV